MAIAKKKAAKSTSRKKSAAAKTKRGGRDLVIQVVPDPCPKECLTINDFHLKSAGRFLWQNKLHRQRFFKLAQEANKVGQTGKLREDLASKLRTLKSPDYPTLSAAEVAYIAGWAALAVEKLRGKSNDDEELRKLIDDAVCADPTKICIVAG